MAIRLLMLAATLVLLAGCESSQRWVYHQGMDFEKWRAGLEEHTVSTDDGLRWRVLQSSDADQAFPSLGRPLTHVVDHLKDGRSFTRTGWFFFWRWFAHLSYSCAIRI